MNSKENMLYLCLSELKGEAPSAEKVKDMDLSEIFRFSKGHKVTALVCSALERVTTPPKEFTEAKIKAMRKDMLLDEELRKISAFLREKEIFYMPLKGAILKELYPGIGLREMSDVDIYYDSASRGEVKDYMLSRGYECISEADSQDVYKRDPVYNFEMHHLLFSKAESETFHEYYKDINNRLQREEGNPFSLKMTPEDFYIFIILHEYKHFSSYGTGVRSLLDVIVLLEYYEETLDWNYIRCELEKTGLAEFEQKQRLLTKKLICPHWEEAMDKEDRELLSYFFESGVYGKTDTGIVNKLTGKAGNNDRKVSLWMKIKYVFRRIFPPFEYYRLNYPFFYKHKILIPFCVIYRLFLSVFRRNDFVKTEIRTLKEK